MRVQACVCAWVYMHCKAYVSVCCLMKVLLWYICAMCMCVCLHNCTSVRACAHVWPICACVCLYNCTSMFAYICTMFMHVCVRLAKLMDQAEKILQLQVNSSCSGRGIIAMQPRCGCTSVKTLMETDFFLFFYQHISLSLSQCNHFMDLQVCEFDLFLMRKWLSSGQKWFLRP